jgi:DNA-binding transcriptional regulator LsrR (DeoR family)
LASYLPNQPLSVNLESFSDAVKRLMKEKGMTRAELIKRSGLSKYVISRILRNTNDKGGINWSACQDTKSSFLNGLTSEVLRFGNNWNGA